MDAYFLGADALDEFITSLMTQAPVIAPVAKRSRFVFAELTAPDELRLDYDTTILPPKAIFFPPRQPLISFTGTTFASCSDPHEQILFGVHLYDIKAIDMADTFYTDHSPDGDYLANRQVTTIVGTSVQTHYPHAFFGTACQERVPQGHDLFLTRIAEGYVAAVNSPRGEALLVHGSFVPASDHQCQAADAVNRQADLDCPKRLHNTSAEIRLKVRDHFDDADFWNACSRDCFSCGSCNTVCPTCYCFDVQDEWDIDGVSGVRTRSWDACLTCEFAEISIQNKCENFRDTPAKRFPHRIMRKTTYMNEQLGGPACVGCGRCAGACTADIADPTTIINTLMER
jgi:sulfhydrogenase subunit beta (sulfur reductase)